MFLVKDKILAVNEATTLLYLAN